MFTTLLGCSKWSWLLALLAYSVPLSSVASGNPLSLSLLSSKMGIQNTCLYRISVKNLMSHAWDITF